MKKIITIFVISVGSLLASETSAQTRPESSWLSLIMEPSYQDEIPKVIQSYVQAWNAMDGNRFAECFTEDASFVNIMGMCFEGRSEIADRHVKIFQGFLKDSKLQVLNVKLREVQSDVVVALITWRLEGFRQPGSDPNTTGTTQEGVFTQVFINNEDGWFITASQNTLFR